MTRARDLADSADKDIAGTLTLDDLSVSGSVGVGTTSLPFLTTISSTANAYSSYNVDVSNLQLAIQNPTNATGSGVGLGFGLSDNTDNIGAAIVHTRADSESRGSLHFATKSANASGADIPVRMTLNSDGQLGVGISPVANLQVHKDNTRIALSADTANLAAQHRIEFWEGQATATATAANMAIEYDGSPINASDGALLIKGSGSSPLSGNDYTFAAFNRNGSCLLPHQAGFMAYAQPSRNSSSYLYNYSNILYNNGSYYNNTNGRFTAPVDGVYEFIGSSMWDSSTSSSSNILYLSVNGATNVGANYGSRSQTTVIGHLPLSAGDYVHLYSDLAPFASTPRNWFMGRLLG